MSADLVEWLAERRGDAAAAAWTAEAARATPWSAAESVLAATIGGLERLPAEQDVRALASALRPWRKGPWRLPCADGVVEIEAEWRADWKWTRLRPFLGNVEEGFVVDVGCGNGYYLSQLAGVGVGAVLGIDPQPMARLQWALVERLRALAGTPVAPAGVPATLHGGRLEALDALPRCADVVLAAGLLYHVTDPIAALRRMATALGPGGRLVLETIVVAGDDPVAWTPPRRYLGARGFWALPTRACLEAWVERAGLRASAWSEPIRTTAEEQRATPWTFGPGIAAGLDPADPDRTIEGLPAPWRIIGSLTPG
jgi:tRNA (mo5U34)-methyltransferase